MFITVFVPAGAIATVVVTLQPNEVVLAGAEAEFKGTLTGVACSVITVSTAGGVVTVDTTFAGIEQDSDGEVDLLCTDLVPLIGSTVEIEGAINLTPGVVTADEIKVESELGGDDWFVLAQGSGGRDRAFLLLSSVEPPSEFQSKGGKSVYWGEFLGDDFFCRISQNHCMPCLWEHGLE